MLKKLPTLVSALALVVLLLVLLKLGELEREGPPQRDYQLEGGIPATLVMPEAAQLSPWSSEPPPFAERPPAVVLAHGFMSDRAGMSTLARSLAVAGYAVLNIDLHGHGANRNAFTRPGRVDSFLVQDLRTAADFLRDSRRVDGSRIAVMGHSMGAGAALSYGTVDPAVDALVMISGGREMLGPQRPPNTLFVFAEGDPQRLRDRVPLLASRLAGVAEAEPGKIYGDFRRGTAVRQIAIPGTDHVTIISSSAAVAEIVDWLDRAFEIERDQPAAAVDPRRPVAALGLLAFLFLLPGIGISASRLAPVRAKPPASGGVAGLLTLGAALVVSLPFFAAGSPARPLLLEAGDVLGAYLGLAGLLVLVAHTLLGRFSPQRLVSELRTALLPAALALLAIYLVLTPLGVMLHAMTPTPERMLVGLLYTLVLLPFTLAFQHLLRRGSLLRASLLSLAGRALVLGAIVAGVQLGVIASVVMLIVPIVALLFVMFEIAASAIYASSRNVALAALLEAGWLAWVMSVSLPIRV